MPVHDWTRVSAGTFHHFHLHWIARLSEVVESLLPPDYYVMAEQSAGEVGPDLLALRVSAAPPRPQGGTPGTTAVALHPPPVPITCRAAEEDIYAAMQRSLIIRHSSEDQIIAMVEIVSSGNKSSQHAIRTFREKAAGALRQGIHLLILDLYPPGPRDPQGIHGVIWDELTGQPYQAPAGKPLTLVAYAGGLGTHGYVYPIAVGDTLPDMPLFLDPGEYITVPLEGSYQGAFARVPARLRQQLEQ